MGTFVVVAPQLLGGATSTTQLAIVAGGALAAGYCAFAFRHTLHSVGCAPAAALATAVAALWTLFQALPVPCSWVASAQPERMAVARSLVALGVHQAPRCTLSLAPGGTWAQFGLAATLPALALSATVAARAGHRKILLSALAISSAVMACVALAHAVVGAEAVFGLYDPKYARAQFLLAPLMNENHLAGHLALGFPICLAFARTSKRVDAAILWWTASFVTFVGGLLSLSRGGTAALIAGGGAYLLIELRSRRARSDLKGSLVAVAGGTACMALGAYFAADAIARQFPAHESPLRKILTALKLGQTAWVHPLAGIGRGALGDVSARSIFRNNRYLFAENVFIQWVLEWGFPLTLLITALFAVSFAKLRLRQRVEWGLACGFFALLAQNLVDFSLELAGMACISAVALGVLTAREEPSSRTPWLNPKTAALPALAVASGAAILSVALASPWLTTWARFNLQNEIEQGLTKATPARELAPLLTKAFLHYPLDPAFLVLGSALAVRDNAATVPRWLNLAFDAAPGWAAPHLQAATYLERVGRLDQAAVELGLGIALNPSHSGRACAFLKRHPSSELVWAIVPPDSLREQQAREAMTDCLIQERLWAEADKALLLLLERFPASEYAHQRLVLTAANRNMKDLALARAQTMLATLKRSPASVATLADLLSGLGRPADALLQIDRAPRSARGTREVLMAEATAAAHVRNQGRLDAALEKLLAGFGTTAQTRPGLLLFASQRDSLAGNHVTALSRARAAYDLNGDVRALELAHQAAVEGGMVAAALRTAAELCNVGHRGKAFCGEQRPLVNPRP